MIAALAFMAVRADAQSIPPSIVVGVDSHIENLAPHRATTFADHVLAQTLHRGLVQYDGNGQIVPGLADRWTVSGNGRTYTFFLKPTLRWSDGTPLGAKDIVAGLKHALAPTTRAPFAARLFPIVNAEANTYSTPREANALGVSISEDGSIIIRLSERSVGFLHTLAHPVAMPVPASNPDGLEDGKLTSGDYTVRQQTDDGDIVLQPVGSGQTLTLVPVESATQAWSLAQDKEPFLTANMPIVSVPTVGEYADHVRRDDGEALYAYAVNMLRPPFDTIDVRHALAMAIRRPALMREVRIAGALSANQYISPSIMGGLASYRIPFAPLTYEEREAVAAALLSELGFGLDNPLQVSLRIPSGDIHRRIADVVSDMWAAAGIQTDIIEAPLPDHWAALDHGDFDVAFMAWPGPRDTPLGILEPLSVAGGPWNFPRYGFADFSDRLARAAEESDLDDRLEYYREAEKAIIEDQTIIALFFYSPLAFVSPALEGWIANTGNRHPLTTLSLKTPIDGLDLIRPSLPQSVPSFGADP